MRSRSAVPRHSSTLALAPTDVLALARSRTSPGLRPVACRASAVVALDCVEHGSRYDQHRDIDGPSFSYRILNRFCAGVRAQSDIRVR